MRMKLYALDIERSEITVSGYVVAGSEKRAAIMVIDHDLALGKQHESFSLERIDLKMPLDRRKGLEEMLAAGTSGFARYNEPAGWSASAVVDEPLYLFRIFTPEGDETYVVAADDREAAEIYMVSYTLKDGEHRLFKIVDGLPICRPSATSGSLHC